MFILNGEKRRTNLAAWKFALLLSFVVLSLVTSAKADKVTDWNAIGAQALLNGGNAGAAGTPRLGAGVGESRNNRRST